MDDHSSPELSADEAARIIYNTHRPTPQQVGQVRLRLVRGHLKSGPSGGTTTTAAAIAEYMTTVQVAKQPKPCDSGELSGLYRDLFRDYFMAVVTRRRIGNRSPLFLHAVLAGQIATLATVLIALALIVRSTINPESPEQKLVRAWIEQQHGSVTFHVWFPPFPLEGQAATQLRVQFTYRTSNRKSIRTDRTYQISHGQVSEVTDDDSD